MLVASVLYGTGVQWTALQGVAWAGMIATRVSESSWADAVKSTFSGEKPCRVCRVVEKGSAAEQGPTPLRASPALDLISSAVDGLSVVLEMRASFAPSSLFGASASFPPLLPPPLALLPV